MAAENKRAEEMWSYIDSSIDFRDKRVLDLGCGPGDFLTRSLLSGASFVMGVETDYVIASWADARMLSDGWALDRYAISVNDIDSIVLEDDKDYKGFDIIICFSVLPYLDGPGNAMLWVKDNCDVAVIECQYHGDGPGPEYIKNDDDMSSRLKGLGWGKVDKIGWTDVRIRPAKRSIWKCYE